MDTAVYRRSKHEGSTALPRGLRHGPVQGGRKEFPPFGVLYLAAAIRSAGHHVEIQKVIKADPAHDLTARTPSALAGPLEAHPEPSQRISDSGPGP